MAFIKNYLINERMIVMEQKTTACGWWGFPNQTYHSGLFVIAKDQEVQVSIGQNVSNAWIE